MTAVAISVVICACDNAMIAPSRSPVTARSVVALITLPKNWIWRTNAEYAREFRELASRGLDGSGFLAFTADEVDSASVLAIATGPVASDGLPGAADLLVYHTALPPDVARSRRLSAMAAFGGAEIQSTQADPGLVMLAVRHNLDARPYVQTSFFLPDGRGGTIEVRASARSDLAPRAALLSHQVAAELLQRLAAP